MDLTADRQKIYRWLRRCLIGPEADGHSAPGEADLRGIQPLERFQTAILSPVIKDEYGLDAVDDGEDFVTRHKTNAWWALGPSNDSAPRTTGVRFPDDPPLLLTPRFILLHTLAHLLIRQLETQAGYAAASIRERIYCAGGPEPMAGILGLTGGAGPGGRIGWIGGAGGAEAAGGIEPSRQ